MRDFAVEADRLDGAMGLEHDRAPRRFVAPSRLHADVAILHQVQPADAVPAADAVELGQHRGGGERLAVEGDDVSRLVLELQIFGRVGRSFGRHRPPPHVVFGFLRRIFERTSFVADVQQVGIHRIRTAAALVLHLDGNAVLLGVRQQTFA